MVSKIYFTKDLTSNGLIKVFDAVGVKLNGKVVECNTAYDGARTNNKDHLKLLEKHGWTKYFNVDLMDSDGDIALDIPNGKILKKDYVGKNLLNYDSMLVICHAKGHPMAGFGNALKQLSI